MNDFADQFPPDKPARPLEPKRLHLEVNSSGEGLRGLIRNWRHRILRAEVLLPLFVVALAIFTWSLSQGSPLPDTGRPEDARQAQTAPREAYSQETKPEPVSIQPQSQPRFAVQVGAYKNRERAEAVAQLLSSHYGQVLLAPQEVAGKVLYRVRIPVETEAKAKTLAATLRQESQMESWVVSLP